MTPRLKEILERRKANADTQTATEVKGETDTESPDLILVPSFVTNDEFSEFF